MSNSQLVDYVKISPYCSSPRNNTIKKITIHHMAGNLSVETCGNVFQSSQSSANYGVGNDGRIGMYVEEKNRSWASSSPSNDHQAITIEVANDGGASTNWHVSDKALARTVDLCVDICKRNGIKKLNYTGDSSGNLTRHNMFAATTCPGPYLQSKFPWIAEQVNARLGSAESTTSTSKVLYRVRKSWDDAKSQLGAFANLDGAKETCDKAGSGYYVFDNDGKVVYPVKVETTTQTDVKKLYRVRKTKDDAKTQKGAFSNLNGAIECCQAAGEGYHVFDWDYNVVYSYKAPVEQETKPAESEKEPVVEQDKTPVEAEKEVAVYDLDYPEKIKIVESDKEQDDSELKKNCTKTINKILENNPDFDVEIAKAFFKLAPKYGVNPMMAISQSILETGWFKYQGSAVKPEHHNYCGLGVTSNGITGGIFDTIENGVRAQLQHLYAYGCKDEMPEGEETIVDPRFKYVTRGIAPYWQNLAGRWAVPGYDKNTYVTPKDAMNAGNTYGQRIHTICLSVEKVEVTDEDVEKYFPVETKPDDNIANNIPSVDTTLEEDVMTLVKLIKKVFEYIIGLFKSK